VKALQRIYSHQHDNCFIDLVNPQKSYDWENCFTVVVGKNGVGKSRLLSDIALRNTIYSPFDLSGNSHKHAMGDGTRNAPKVIAVSTSPFDKFPSFRRKGGVELDSNYRYVGMRGEGPYQPSSAVGLMASASKGLLDKLLSRTAGHNLLSVFDALNFNPVVEFVFKPGYIGSKRVEYDLYKVGDSSLRIELECLLKDHGIKIDSRYFALLESSQFELRHALFESMVTVNKLLSHRRAVELSVDFLTGEAFLDSEVADGRYIEAILMLMNAGLMRLIDLRLQKIGFGELSVRRASSGEQCLLVLMFGIAGHITDNSLILIDEPEISLHPRWQEEFMVLLTTSFSAYNGCQFIVATHSPQIISRLKDRGCFIASLSKGVLFDAEDFYHRSADYQLAELFDAPGLMNEYISRLAFNLLAQVKARRSIDKLIGEDLKRLIELDRQVEKNDPVKELIASVVQLCGFYAVN
jgi:predicted ATPase